MVRPGVADAGRPQQQEHNHQFDRFHGTHPFLATTSAEDSAARH
jgi:hypothetical protein